MYKCVFPREETSEWYACSLEENETILLGEGMD